MECIEESQGNELSQIKRLYDREVQDLKDSIENLTKTYRDLQANSDKILKDNRYHFVLKLKQLQFTWDINHIQLVLEYALDLFEYFYY